MSWHEKVGYAVIGIEAVAAIALFVWVRRTFRGLD
jgi:hypothetical protein